MVAEHTPGPLASLEISLRIGQRVRHQDFHGKRVTGVVRGLSVDSEDALHADIVLDEAIVLPPMNDDDHELRIYRQHVPAHELAPFDERDELIAQLLEAAQAAWNCIAELSPTQARVETAQLLQAAIEKATGSGS